MSLVQQGVIAYSRRSGGEATLVKNNVTPEHKC